MTRPPTEPQSTSTRSAEFLDEDGLITRYTGADSTTLAEFWADVTELGTPLRDPASHRLTFLWRDPGRAERVHLHLNRITDKDNHSAGYMARVPCTDIWVRTLEIAPTLRVSYGFHSENPTDPPRPGPFSPRPHPTRPDPFNPRPPLLDDGVRGLSLLTGPLSPAQPEWETADPGSPLQGTVVTGQLPLATGLHSAPERTCRLYLPPVSDPVVATPLVTVFDAETWFDGLHLPRAVERAVNLARIPPVAVLGITNLDRADRVNVLGANPLFLESVAGVAVPWAEEVMRTRGMRLAGIGQRVLAGQSLGGLSGLFAAHIIPDAFGTLICQSPSLWWTPDGRSTPSRLGQSSADWITEIFAAEPAGPARILLDVGTREGLTLPRTHQLHATLRHRGWDTAISVYDGGHDLAWWRGALFDRLEQTLPPH